MTQINNHAKPVNILFLHSHNTGRYIQPMGHAVATKNLQQLAEQGVLFRQAFATAPTCSPSRASFMTGQFPHAAGMFGLAHRGFALEHPQHHIARYLSSQGYQTALAGVEHSGVSPTEAGYDLVLSNLDPNYPETKNDPLPEEKAAMYLKKVGGQPFFLSVGLNETHRPFSKPQPDRHPLEDSRFCLPPRPLPDDPVLRADMAAFKASVRQMDESFGRVLRALDDAKLSQNTLVFCFSDHGLQFPRNMCTLSDHGIGVYLIVRGPGGFEGGQVCDQMASLIDLFATACDVPNIAPPPWLQGQSLRKRIDGSENESKQQRSIFAQINYHAAYEPVRCVRTQRYKYIRRFSPQDTVVLANIDESPGKTLLIDKGWSDRRHEPESLYDLVFDPDEVHNLAQQDESCVVLDNMRQELAQWMIEMEDPLHRGAVAPPSGAQLNRPDQPSPKSPKFTAT